MKNRINNHNNICVVLTEVETSEGMRDFPYSDFEKMSKAGIVDVYILLSPEETQKALEKRVFITKPVSAFDLFQEAASKQNINLRILTVDTVKSDQDKFDYFMQTNRVNHSHYHSAFFIPSTSSKPIVINKTPASDHLTVKSLYIFLLNWLVEGIMNIMQDQFLSLNKYDMDVLSRNEMQRLSKAAIKSYVNYYEAGVMINKSEAFFEKENHNWWNDWTQFHGKIRPKIELNAQIASDKRQSAYEHSHRCEKELVDLCKEFGALLKHVKHMSRLTESKADDPLKVRGSKRT